MPANYVLLRKTTLTSSATSVTFSNIPQSGYTDLKIVMSTRDARSGVDVSDILFNFNSTGVGNGITGRYLYGTGSSVTTATTVDGLAFGGSAANTSNTFGNSEVYISNYLSTNSYKSISSDSVSENNAAGAFQLILAGLWSNNSAIHTISMTPYASPFSADSEFSLYGLAALGTTPVIMPHAGGGDSIVNDGTYWIHTFLSSGIFAPTKTITCDYLVVAGGGGGGGGYSASGAGAGGLRTTTSVSGTSGGGGSLESPISINAGSYAITVGAGGAAGLASNGINGSNSVFSTITSTGGGAGVDAAGVNSQIGRSGGSGGGAVGYGTEAGGAASPSGQGYPGGSVINSGGSWPGGAGGGGAGAAGGTASGANSSPNATGGAGGNGVAVSITGTSITYAGGGGGTSYYNTSGSYSGGSGGGGAGVRQGTGVAGTTNLGAGGGGGGGGGGGKGGSGIVVIRYPIA